MISQGVLMDQSVNALEEQEPIVSVSGVGAG